MIRRLTGPAEEDLVGDLLIQQIGDRDLVDENSPGFGTTGVYERAWIEIQDRTNKTLRKHYRDTFRKSVLALAYKSKATVDPVQLNAAADDWAVLQAAIVSQAVTETAKKRITQKFAELDPKGFGYLTKNPILRDVFDKTRAEVIGSTETTRAAAAGEAWFSDQYNQTAADPLIPVWITAADERTCYICAPLHNTLPVDLARYGVPAGTEIKGTISGWDAIYASGPPAHPRCRCSLKWVKLSSVAKREMAKLKQTKGGFPTRQPSPSTSRPRMARLKPKR